MLYNDVILENFLHPKNAGEIENADGTGEVGSIGCGDVVRLTIRVEDDIITDAKFAVFGGAAALACASFITNAIKNKTTEEALSIASSGELDRALGGLPAARLKSAVFVCEAVQAAIKNYYDKNGIGYDPFDFALGCSICDGCEE